MSLSDVIYSPLAEEEKQLAGWFKSTIDYVESNKTKVHNSIRGIAKSLNKNLQRADVEDIYMEIIEYLYSCDDYNVSKAYERSNAGVIVSLEGYVHTCIRFCVIRYVTSSFNNDKHIMSEHITDEDGKELSLFDTIYDSKNSIQFSTPLYPLDTICKSFECDRYAFGPDIFQVWFVRMLTIIYEKAESYKDILQVLGITKKEIDGVEKESNADGAMISIAKAITLITAEEAVSILKKYTYSAEQIQKVVELF